MNIPIVSLLCGAAAGFLAGQFVKGKGMGLLGNIVVGVLGGFIFALLFGKFNIFSSSVLNEIGGGTIGAVILLWTISLFKQ